MLTAVVILNDRWSEDLLSPVYQGPFEFKKEGKKNHKMYTLDRLKFKLPNYTYNILFSS